MASALLDMETAYSELRPLFFAALGKLARQGFVVPPTDSLDLIHDFFADEWRGLKKNFDPSRGSYKAYAYGAFVQFVRPRIIRMQRIQNFRVTPEEVDRIGEIGAVEPDWETSHDRELVIRAISELPDLESRILHDYLHSDRPSERMLARQFSISRYRLRDMLIDALGRLVVSLDKPDRMPERDWLVARALWKEELSTEEAARHLGITEPQVRLANARNIRFLAKTLSMYHPAKRRDLRRHEMESTTQKSHRRLEPEELFKMAMTASGNDELLRQVAERADEVIAVLERPDAIDICDEDLIKLNPQWVAQLYDVLAKGNGASEQEVEGSNELFYANVEDEYQIGVAYEQALIAGLPRYFADLAEHWLAPKLPPVSKDEMSYLMESPAAQGAGVLSEPLARYGVTPLTVFDSTEATSRLLDRFIRRGRLDPEKSIVMSLEGIHNDEFISSSRLADEISRVAVCGKPTAQVLYEWSIGVAQRKPLLFSGFQATGDRENAVVLIHTGEKMNNLYERWGLVAAPQVAAVS